VKPSDPSDRGRLLWTRGDAAGALAWVNETLDRDPANLKALLLKGEILLEAREGDEALRAHERAVEVAPRSSEAWNGLARCRHALGDDLRALEAAQEAKRLLGEGENFRETAPVYLTLVWCLRERRLYQEALDAAEEGLERTPDAILAQWATTVADELAEAQKERC